MADDDQRAAREAVRRGDILPLAQVIEAATRRVPGEVIEVELDREDDGWEYEIKVLTPSGRVREITLNARTGAILEIEDD
ncbi:MAG TPA: PepSY domain-containing protein [Terricaulis sp.]|nr:PepSY domain-containing protein [Terricaulis sp.]